MSRRARGFTLVELLVVIAIIAVLAALIVPITRTVRLRSQVKACKVKIETLVGALEQYASDFGDYPPTSLRRLGVLRTNRVNEGAEALVRCLTTTRRGGPYHEWKDEELGNLDGDMLDGADPTASSIAAAELLEPLDPWGNPYVYYHHLDYQQTKDLERYATVTGEREACAPQPSETTKRFPGFGKFVIWSLGPDGRNQSGGGDDVSSWR